MRKLGEESPPRNAGLSGPFDENAEAAIDHSLARAARLRQSILKRAFSGQLVPQDPHDEPAGAMLERLQSGRSLHKGNDKSGQTGGKAAKKRRIK